MTFEMASCLCPPDEGDERSHVESCKNTGWWSSSSAVIDWDRAEDEIDKCFDRATYPNPNYQLKFGELVVSVKMMSIRPPDNLSAFYAPCSVCSCLNSHATGRTENCVVRAAMYLNLFPIANVSLTLRWCFSSLWCSVLASLTFSTTMDDPTRTVRGKEWRRWDILH